jgi:hypothetical protein
MSDLEGLWRVASFLALEPGLAAIGFVHDWLRRPSLRVPDQHAGGGAAGT